MSDGTIDRKSACPGVLAELLEIDLSGEVCFARRGQRVFETVIANPLQRIAGARLQMTVVDEQRRKGRPAGHLVQALQQGQLAAGFSDIAATGAREPALAGNSAVLVHGERQRPGMIECDDTAPPGPLMQD